MKGIGFEVCVHGCGGKLQVQPIDFYTGIVGDSRVVVGVVSGRIGWSAVITTNGLDVGRGFDWEEKTGNCT